MPKFKLNSNFVYVLGGQWQQISFECHSEQPAVWPAKSRETVPASSANQLLKKCMAAAVHKLFSDATSTRRCSIGKYGNVVSAAPILSRTMTRPTCFTVEAEPKNSGWKSNAQPTNVRSNQPVHCVHVCWLRKKANRLPQHSLFHGDNVTKGAVEIWSHSPAHFAGMLWIRRGGKHAWNATLSNDWVQRPATNKQIAPQSLMLITWQQRFTSQVSAEIFELWISIMHSAICMMETKINSYNSEFELNIIFKVQKFYIHHPLTVMQQLATYKPISLNPLGCVSLMSGISHASATSEFFFSIHHDPLYPLSQVVTLPSCAWPYQSVFSSVFLCCVVHKPLLLRSAQHSTHLLIIGHVPYYLSLALHTLSITQATPMMLRMSSSSYLFYPDPWLTSLANVAQTALCRNAHQTISFSMLGPIHVGHCTQMW